MNKLLKEEETTEFERAEAQCLNKMHLQVCTFGLNDISYLIKLCLCVFDV